MKDFSQEFLEIQPYDPVSDKFQCLECGKWFKSLGYLHLRKHGLTPTEYKERYGINRWQAIASMAARRAARDVGLTIGRFNLRPAPLVGGGMKGKKNPRRKQTLVACKNSGVWRKAAAVIKKNWAEGKYDYLRKFRSKKAEEVWNRTPYAQRLERTRPGRSTISKLTGTDALTERERRKSGR